MKLVLLWMVILLSSPAFSYELVIIKTMDISKKTFVIRKGKKDGVVVGKKSTFTANNVSVIAKAIQTSREFSQWRIINSEVALPFTKEDIVSYYDTTEYLWTLTPEKNRLKYLKKQLVPPLKNFFSVYGGFSRGMNQSYDQVTNQAVERGGYDLDLLYDKEFTYDIVLSAGLRFSREAQNFATSSFVVSRMLLIGEISYYFKPIRNLAMTRFHVGTSFGWGQSATSSDQMTQTGYATMLPAIKLGFEIPYETYRFMSNIGIETISALEEQLDGTKQSYQTTNAKLMLGLKFFL